MILQHPHPMLATVCAAIDDPTAPEVKATVARLHEAMHWSAQRGRPALDVTGHRRTFKLRDMDARCALHELDHLDGVMILDRREA